MSFPLDTQQQASNDFLKKKFQEVGTSYTQFHGRIIKKLDDCENILDKWRPPLSIQNSYDLKVNEILQEFNSSDTEWNKFNAWLEDNGQGHWFSQLATFLGKLPVKSARNILRLLANIVKISVLATTETVMHPLKTVVKLAKLLIELVHNLIQPETWTRLGIGLIGSSLATLTITSNPLAVISTGIGAALAIAGISVGTLKTVLIAQKDKRFSDLQDYLTIQAKTGSEDLLTAYCLGLLLQAVQRIMRSFQEMHYKRLNQHAIGQVNKQNQTTINISKSLYTENQRKEFLQKYDLPKAEISTKGDLNFNVRWRMDRVKHGDLELKELSEANLVFENIQTGIIETKKDVWINGHYATMYINRQVFDKATNTTKTTLVPQPYFVPGRWSVATTKTPTYEKFFGYNVSVKGWVQPPLEPYPQPIPVPVKPLLPLDTRLAVLGQEVNSFGNKD